MNVSRRVFLKNTSLAGACLVAGESWRSTHAASGGAIQDEPPDAYKYRVAFGAWINDMRSEALPLQNWPAPQLDDDTIASAIRALDVQSEAGFNILDVFGLFATYGYPPDVATAFADKERRRRVNGLIAAADKRRMTMTFGMGLFTWGYDKIIQQDPSVRGVDKSGNPHPHAMCGAKEKAWGYVERILDVALGEFDFGGVHLESADLGWCACPKCAGKDGVVGYNVRLNIRAADYIRSKWPGRFITCIPINWVGGNGTPFTPEEEEHVVELSKHIDCFMDQGWRQPFVCPDRRKEFISKLHCDYGTSGGIWLYPCVRRNRLSYFLPYPRRTGSAIKRHYEHGARGSMIYQGPMLNPATEINCAVAGRILSDTTRDVDEALAEAVEVYYKPTSEKAHKALVEVYGRGEDAFFENWPEEAKKNPNRPGEFHLTDLFGDTPGPSKYLQWNLTPQGRGAYRKELITILKDLQRIEHDFRDGGRIRRIKTCLISVLVDIENIGFESA